MLIFKLIFSGTRVKFSLVINLSEVKLTINVSALFLACIKCLRVQGTQYQIPHDT